MISPDDPISARAQEILEGLLAAALAAGFEMPVWGAVVIAARALALLDADAPRARHPDGRGGGQD